MGWCETVNTTNTVFHPLRNTFDLWDKGAHNNHVIRLLATHSKTHIVKQYIAHISKKIAI